MVSRYRTLLSMRGVRRLLVTSVLARLPLGMNSLAILLFVRSHSGSFVAAGLAVGAFTAAAAATAPVQGRLLDRLGQPRVLLPCAVGEAFVLVGMALAGGAGAPIVAIVALSAAAGALLPPVSACVRTLWPTVAPDTETREAIYALDATTQEIIWTLGPMIVAIAVGLGSAADALGLCAAITLLGVASFVSAPEPRAWRPTHVEGARREGALASSGLRKLLSAVALIGGVIGAFEVGLPALAAHLGSPSSAGVLLACWSGGSMIGGVLYGGRRWAGSMGTRHLALLLGIAILAAPLLFARSLGLAATLSALAGLSLAPLFSCQYSLVGALAPHGSVAEAFNWHVAALVAGAALGSASAGVLVAAAGSTAPFVLACLCALAAFLVAAFDGGRIAGRVADTGSAH